MFMCKVHWFQVPLALRREIWRTYRSGQERMKTPSEDYLVAAKAAIAAVAQAEARQRA